MPQRAFCRRMDVLPSKVKAKPPGTLCISATFRRNTLRQTDKACRIMVVADVPYASARSKGTVPIPCAANSREKRDCSDELCAIFFAHFSSRWLGLQKPTVSAFATRSRNECDIVGDQIPTPSSFRRFRFASKAHD